MLLTKFIHNKAGFYIPTVICALILLTLSFEGLWEAHVQIIYAAAGLLGVCVILIRVIRGRLWQHADFWLLLLFLLFAWFSATYSFGVTLRFFFSRFFCIWMACFGLYLTIQAVPDTVSFLRQLSVVFAGALTLLCIYVLIHASGSLLTKYPGNDAVHGCFQKGRLCGISNANILGMACTALVMVSVYGIFTFKGFFRIYFSVSAFIGWFCLGMTGFRTGFVGIAAAFGIDLYFRAIRGLSILRLPVWARQLIAGVCAASATVAIIFSCLLPMKIYKEIMAIIGKLSGHLYLSDNIRMLTIRDFTEHIDTMTDRTEIWRCCIRDCFKNTRKAFLGISSLSTDDICGIYDGYHEISAPHAHNAFLEILRRFGLTGLTIWMILLVRWCRAVIKTLFDNIQEPAVKIPAACAAGMMVMGLAESVPFAHAGQSQLPLLFYLFIGMCVSLRRNKS